MTTNQAKIEGDKLIEMFKPHVGYSGTKDYYWRKEPNAIKCSVILCKSHIYSEYNNIFSSAGDLHKNNEHWNAILKYLESL